MKDTYVIEEHGLKVGLSFHLEANFYPPLPSYVKESIMDAFQDHWDGKLNDMDKLKDRCYLRDVDGLYRYFSEFINEEF